MRSQAFVLRRPSRRFVILSAAVLQTKRRISGYTAVARKPNTTAPELRFPPNPKHNHKTWQHPPDYS